MPLSTASAETSSRALTTAISRNLWSRQGRALIRTRAAECAGRGVRGTTAYRAAVHRMPTALAMPSRAKPEAESTMKMPAIRAPTPMPALKTTRESASHRLLWPSGASCRATSGVAVCSARVETARASVPTASAAAPPKVTNETKQPARTTREAMSTGRGPTRSTIRPTSSRLGSAASAVTVRTVPTVRSSSPDRLT